MCCVGYLLAQFAVHWVVWGLDTDKRAVGWDWRLHWWKLYLINTLPLKFFTIWKANVLLAVFTVLENVLDGRSLFCEVRMFSLFVWSCSAILVELGMYESVPLVATASSYFLFSCTNTVNAQSYKVEAPLVPFDRGFQNDVWYHACSVSKVPCTISLC